MVVVYREEELLAMLISAKAKEPRGGRGTLSEREGKLPEFPFG